jgi:hypothetical protein
MRFEASAYFSREAFVNERGRNYRRTMPPNGINNASVGCLRAIVVRYLFVFGTGLALRESRTQRHLGGHLLIGYADGSTHERALTWVARTLRPDAFHCARTP